MNPEGIVVCHTASGQLFKKTLDNNDKHKGNSNLQQQISELTKQVAALQAAADIHIEVEV